MNILFLSREYPPNHIGGVGIYVYEMSRLLVENGHRVFIITEAIETPLEYLDHGATVYRIKAKRLAIFNAIRQAVPGFVDRLEYSFAVSKRIKEVHERHSIDIVESCEARAEGFWFRLFHKNPPLVIKLHTPERIVYKLNREQKNIDRYLLEKLEGWWITNADKVIGLSNAIVKLVRKDYLFKQRYVPIVPNPIDSDFFIPIDIANHSNQVLYVGRLEFRKGVHVFMRAIPLIIKEIPQVKFIFVGDDCGMRAYLINKFRQSEIRDSIEFVDCQPRSRLLSFYQHSTLCVVPSLWENQPYALLEAMACARPVVATNVGGIPEIVKSGINGILVDPGSAQGLAEAIVQVLQDKELQVKLGAEARKTIECRYSSKKVLEKSLAIYESLLN